MLVLMEVIPRSASTPFLVAKALRYLRRSPVVMAVDLLAETQRQGMLRHPGSVAQKAQITSAVVAVAVVAVQAVPVVTALVLADTPLAG